MFAYCCNNPIIFTDTHGQFAGVIFGAITGAIDALIKTADENYEGDVLETVLQGTVNGAVWGLLGDFAVATGGIAGLVMAGTLGAAQSAVEYCASLDTNEAVNAAEFMIDVGVGTAFSMLSFGMADNVFTDSGKVFLNRLTEMITGETTRKIGKDIVNYGAKRICKQTTKNLAVGFVETVVLNGLGWCVEESFKQYID